MTSPRLLVTGATGYLGGAVAKAALAQGIMVRGAGRRPSPSRELEWVALDVLDERAVVAAMAGIDVVIHAAALAHVFRPSNVPRTTFLDVNGRGTENVARAAVMAGCRHFVLVSSVAVYGSGAATMVAEDGECRPGSHYAESKLLAEARAREQLAAAGIPLTILRMTTLYGENNPGNVNRLMQAIDRGRFIWIGSGSQRKSLIHRDDAARACLAAALAPAAAERIFNVTAAPATMKEIVDGLHVALGRVPPRWHIPDGWLLGATRMASALAGPSGLAGAAHATLKTWLADAVFDGGRFERELQFRPQVALQEGLRRQVESYRSRRA
jgi:nucleoside-diphosphate-sugar epimerase